MYHTLQSTPGRRVSPGARVYRAVPVADPKVPVSSCMSRAGVRSYRTKEKLKRMSYRYDSYCKVDVKESAILLHFKRKKRKETGPGEGRIIKLTLANPIDSHENSRYRAGSWGHVLGIATAWSLSILGMITNSKTTDPAPGGESILANGVVQV